MKILLLDDEPFVLGLLSHQLAALGFSETVSCERAQDALVLVEAGGFDLVFCDLQMPEMDGVEFVRRLAHIGYDGGLVLISGEDSRILQTAERLARAHKLHVLDALQKPVSPEQLRQVLDFTRTPLARAPRKTYGAEELRQAIANGELENHYQPKVEVATGSVAGVETLVRWRHPRDGLVFPDQFIATAEEHDLIDELTRTVLTTALREARLWMNGSRGLHLAVNVSMDNLADLDFPDFVAQSAADAGVHRECLVLEVTESRLMKNPLAPLDILTRLRLKRIGLSIDDFGTGYSSLAQLHDLPFGELKVDQSFVHGACRDASLRAIFDASLGMARKLNMRTVAEGVEDRDDWDFLRERGCDLAQGYFIARPLPAVELPAWMGEWEGRRDALTEAEA